MSHQAMDFLAIPSLRSLVIKESSTLRRSAKNPFPAAVHVLHGGTGFASKKSNGVWLSSRLRAQAAQTAISDVGSAKNFSERAIAKLIAIVGDASASPLGQATWEEVLEHTAERLKWVDERYEMIVVNSLALQDESPGNICQGSSFLTADIWIVICVSDPFSVEWILKSSSQVPNLVPFESSPLIGTKLKGNLLVPSDPIAKLKASIPGRNETRELLDTVKLVQEAWLRKNSEDVRFTLLVLIDRCVSRVESLKSLRASDLNTLKCMINNCGPQILACLSSPSCRKALSCLNGCAPTDQVCSYQCIVSYESPELEAFSLCVLQKHNCLGLSSSIPMLPNVEPMGVFRGSPLTHDVAEDIFVGWLGKLEWSWRVVAGQNPAYDQFPCQFQIFYRGKAKGSVWYDPVFQVKKLDGSFTWRRRHYRVRRAETPGTFFFSVLDNGVISNEYWRIVDMNDDLSWGLFYYSGAASAAGQAYTGAIIVTPDGQWPAPSEHERLSSALDKCGIKEWEMYKVNNAACEGPLLGIPENAGMQLTSLHV